MITLNEKTFSQNYVNLSNGKALLLFQIHVICDRLTLGEIRMLAKLMEMYSSPTKVRGKSFTIQ